MDQIFHILIGVKIFVSVFAPGVLFYYFVKFLAEYRAVLRYRIALSDLAPRRPVVSSF